MENQIKEIHQKKTYIQYGQKRETGKKQKLKNKGKKGECSNTHRNKNKN